MQSLSEATYTIKLKDREGREHEYTLTPSLQAMQAIQAGFKRSGDARGPWRTALDEIQGFDMASMAAVIKAGGRLSDEATRPIAERLYYTGFNPIVVGALLTYVNTLFTGGKEQSISDLGDDGDTEKNS